MRVAYAKKMAFEETERSKKKQTNAIQYEWVLLEQQKQVLVLWKTQMWLPSAEGLIQNGKSYLLTKHGHVYGKNGGRGQVQGSVQTYM